MSTALRPLTVLLLAVVGWVLAAPATASAAPAASTTGYDVSYPQCGTTLPRDRAFAVVGVNGGLSTKANPCLVEQLRWAAGSSGTVAAQPPVQLYVNTANPGQIRDQVTTWPTSGVNRYGICDGGNTAACSWEYGVERARNSVETFFQPAATAAQLSTAPQDYVWWLDVETTNTWQTGSSEALARNRATLEGMTDYLTSLGGTVGIYSTGQQWSQIVGTVPSSSNLAGKASWLAGATSLNGAKATCRRAPLVPGGRVTLTQYVQGSLDRNWSCV